MVHFYETSRASVAIISQAAWPENRGLPVSPLNSACRPSFRFLTRSAFIGSNLPTRRHYFRFARHPTKISMARESRKVRPASVRMAPALLIVRQTRLLRCAVACGRRRLAYRCI